MPITKPAIPRQLRLSQGCVVSYCPIASSIGLRVLREGGNAVDAAVATGLALAVTYPQAGNLGGGGFMLIKPRGRPVAFLDYRERAPMAFDLDRLASDRDACVLGATSVSVPGTVAGFAEALAKYGSWNWDRIVGVTIDLADKGVWVTSRQATYYSVYEPFLRLFPSSVEAYARDGSMPQAGTLFTQPDLAQTLRRLADEGPGAFYNGSIAERIIATIRDERGFLTEDDLQQYQAVWREPVHCEVAGRHVYAAGLPSGGGLVVALALRAAVALGLTDQSTNPSTRVESLVRVFRAAFALRRELAGDPDQLSAAELTEIGDIVSSPMTVQRFGELEKRFASETKREAAGGSKDTTHYCVIDADGNAVSNTYTLNTLFGSKLAARGCGFLLNNTIDDFRIGADIANWYGLHEGSRAQLVGGRRATGSMTPTIVTSGDDVEFILGGSGGPHIPTMVVQVILNALIGGQQLPQAMLSPRVHHQFVPDVVMAEDALASQSLAALTDSGYKVKQKGRLGIGVGIQHDPASGKLSTILDPRFNIGLTI